MKRFQIYIGFLIFLSLGVFAYVYFTHFQSPASEIVPAGSPQRIICAAPSVTEIVFALGMGDKVVGISEFTTYPPEALKKEMIGGLVNPNMERISALNPDLVIMQGEIRKLTDYCQHKSIPAVKVFMRDLPAIYSEIKVIGKALGCPEKAEELVQSLDQQLNTIRKKALESKPAQVFVCISRKRDSLTNLLTSGKNTYLTELLEIAGGKNIFGDVALDYPQISKESLLTRAPEVVLDLQPAENGTIDMLKDWQQMPLLPAVSSGRVYVVTDESIMIPGPRMGQAVQRFYDLIHR